MPADVAHVLPPVNAVSNTLKRCVFACALGIASQLLWPAPAAATGLVNGSGGVAANPQSHALALDTGAGRVHAPASVSDSDLQALAQSRTWKRLLYIQTGKPEITESKFFLSGFTGQALAQLALSELRETIAQADVPVAPEQDANLHPRCIFPARYFWLGERIGRPAWKQIPDFCVKLNAWLRERPQGVFSLLMVSGYVTNPGSTFGHTLIRLSPNERRTQGDDGVALLDVTFNFGAGIPENEPIPIYIARGLFGGYTSAFSTGTYFQHDQVYSRQEMRDLWSYDLMLTPDESDMARLRVAELLGYRFDYYFLSHNCALRMGQLFDLVTDQNRFPDNPAFMTPIELFHRLNDESLAPRPLLGKVTFVPSHHRRLTHRMRGFSSQQSGVYAQLVSLDQSASVAQIFADNASLRRALKDAGSERDQVAVVDAALSFWEAKILAKQEKEVDLERQRKDRLLKVRLLLPVDAASSDSGAPPLPRPDHSNHVMGLSVGLAHGQSNHFLAGKSGLQFRVTPYKYDHESFHAIQNFGQLRVLDGRLFADSSGRVQLQRLEVMKVSSVASYDTTGLDHVFSRYFSWEMDVGFDRVPNSDRYLDAQKKSGVSGLDGYARFALGPSVRIGDSSLLSLRAASVVATVSDWLTVHPELAFEHRTERLRFMLDARQQRFSDSRAVATGRFLSTRLAASYAVAPQRNVIGWVEQRSGDLKTGVAGLTVEWRF